jgi:hypothetical protein
MALWEMAFVRTQSLPGGAALLGPHVNQEEFIFPQPIEWRNLGENNCQKLTRFGGAGGIYVKAPGGRGMSSHKYLAEDFPLFDDASVMVFHHVNYQHKSILVRRLFAGTLVLMVDITIGYINWSGVNEIKCVASRAITGEEVWNHCYDVDQVITTSRLMLDIREHIMMTNPRTSGSFKISLVRAGTVDALDHGRQVWNPRWVGKLASTGVRLVRKQSPSIQHTLHHFFAKKNKNPVQSRSQYLAMKAKQEAKAAADELQRVVDTWEFA